MTKRSLTEEEKRLWHLYTRDIKPASLESCQPEIETNKPSYEIKSPNEKGFNKRHVQNLSNHESLKNKDHNWGKKLRQGKVMIDGKIDLHGMTCPEAHQKLYNYLCRAQKKGKRVVLVVTGKGGVKKNLDGYRFSDFENSHGILRREVPMWLSGGSMRHLIVSFQEARRQDGGTGALCVVLKRKE